MRRVFEPKVITLVANVAQSITWSVQEFGKYFSQYDAIIRGDVSIRFRVENLTNNVVFLSLNYATLYENIPFQERKNLAAVAANTTAELSKATVPAIGALKTDIVSITITVIGAVAGVVRITLLILDQDELAAGSGAGEFIGSDSAIVTGYLTINQAANQVCNASTNNTLIDYTVPTGKRFYLDYMAGSLEATPSFPDLVGWSAYLPSPTVAFTESSSDQGDKTFIAVQNINYIFSAGQQILVQAFNSDVTARIARAFMLGREVF